MAGALASVPILVIEDDEASRKLLALLLTGAGALVTAVASAEDALVSMATALPRVIVLDLVLPRMGGLVFVEQLKANPVTRDIPIIAVTSLNGPEVRRVVAATGCDEYVKKPVNVETFPAIVAKHLRGPR